jgi:hypothetical protein
LKPLAPFVYPDFTQELVCRIRQAMGLAEGAEHSTPRRGRVHPPRLDLAVPVRVYGAKFGSATITS